ncbi:MAG: Ldh family oxidoreductase [Cellvibrionaceae bacterium]
MKAEALRQFSRSVLVAAGSDPAEATVVADVLVWCDEVGRPNQGVWRLPVLCERLQRGLFESPCHPHMELKTVSLATLDGRAGQGHYVAYQAMNNAIALAKAEGIAAIVVRNSNFFGAGGYYASMAAQTGLIGIALSNSFPKVRAFNGEHPVLGTNPLAFACPAREGEPLVLDMATSALAGSTVRKQRECDSPAKSEAAALEPLGGSKGYGLALLVEIMSGVLSGGGFSHQVKSMYENFHEPGNNGHFFLALDIEKLMPLTVFRERMLTLMDWLAASGATGEVKYPGQNRWEILKQTQTAGVQLDDTTQAALRELARKYQIASL